MKESPLCDCEGAQKIGPGFHAPYCSTVPGGKELRQQLESQTTPDGWCPICGGQDGEHKSGCQDGSEIP